MSAPLTASPARRQPCPLTAVFVLAMLAAAGPARALPVPEVTVLRDTASEVVVRCEPRAEAGGPSPSEDARVVLVRVPDRGRISFRCEPEGRAFVSEPAVLRDLRVVQVTFDIPAYDPQPVTVTITTEPGAGVNERDARARPRCPAFESLYRHAVANYRPDPAAHRPAAGGGRAQGARYLIIANPSFVSQIQPLADWKHRKGVKTSVVTLNETGSSAADIKAYIQNAYDTWEIPPEYVLLVGDTEVVPAYYSETWTDDYYATLEGADYFVDVMVGRLSADTQSQCATLVAKVLSYERNPVQGNPQWPASALLTVADDFDGGDAIYYRNTWFIYDLMEPAGFAPIDTLFKRNYVTQSQVYQSMNAGRGFINYRGVAGTDWMPPFNINPSSLTNTHRLSVVISATCGTGTYQDDGFLCETITRAGSAANPIGAAAFLSTNTSIESSQTLSRRRGAADQGFFAQAFGPDGGVIGAATVAAKTAIYNFDQMRQEYEGWNLLGDPDMMLWTGQPGTLQAFHGSYYHASQDSFVVTVFAAGQPLQGALVACVKGSDVHEWDYSDADGRVVLAPDPSSAGTMAVTVTARNRYPYEGEVTVLDSGPFVVCTEVEVDDAVGGNGDGLLSPGESAALLLRLTNVGDGDAVNVTGTVRTPDQHASIPDSVASFGTIPPGGHAWCVTPYAIVADAECIVGHRVHLAMDVTFGALTIGITPPSVPLATADMSLAALVLDDGPPGGDGAGDLTHGETVAIEVTLENVGPLDAGDVVAELECLSPHVAVTAGTAHLGLVRSGNGATNAPTPFLLSVSPPAPNGHVAEFRLHLSGVGHSYLYEETIAFALSVAGLTTTLPSGPDAYGYYAYDSSDTGYACAPAFEWYDIAPPGPGSLIAQITNNDDRITTISLPFAVKYYGTSHTQASVCSNGFVAMGVEDYRMGTNSPVGSPDGPDRMIAPFWDDLNPAAAGDIYRWMDTENHRFIIQFDGVPIYGTSSFQTFQVVFRHPAYYPTPTGDTEILFLYETVMNPTGCTVGIENPEQTDGIGYLHNGAHDVNAAPLADGLAVLFTTVAAEDPARPWLTLDAVALDDAAGNGNGVAEPGEIVSLALTLANHGVIGATGIGALLTAEEGVAAVIDGAGVFPDVPPGGSASNAADPFVIQIVAAPADTVLTLWAHVEANDGAYSVPVRCDVRIAGSGTGVPESPIVFAVHHATPNPFTGATSLALALPDPAQVAMSVYDVAGRLVRRVDHGVLAAGRHALLWDGHDAGGRPVASGVYFFRVAAGERVVDRKAVLLR
ncbi:MAG: hypothetical protein FJY74_04645 [Candidatus Eisenbacteria bacterium]|nr:hypothetical protein [Candidatus Eisenbacteria bacterium]